MDLGLLHSNFVIDNKDLTLHTTVDGSGVFRDTDGQTHCTIRPFRDVDPDIARDPLSTNRRLFDSGEIKLLDIRINSGFNHMHGGRNMPRIYSTCDRIEAGTDREFGLYLTPRGSAPFLM